LGEEPQQPKIGAFITQFYKGHFQQTTLRLIKGEASFNNPNRYNGAIKIASSFGDRDAICIVKHGNPCGFAIKDTLLESYREALKV